MMDISNQLDFGLDSKMNVSGFDYYRMDLGLANFPIQFPGRSGTSTVQVNITSVCMTTDAFPWPLRYICVQIISTCVSRSSHKKYLKRVLVLKMKLDLARARAKEEAEAAQMAYEHNQRMELRHLEEEASLAELEWKTETEYKIEGHLALLVSWMPPSF